MRETRSRTVWKRSWSRLTDDVSERVLSFLPVPALCRCRTVCRKWNEVLRNQSFFDLWDQNARNKQYLCLTRYLSPEDRPDDGWSAVDDVYRQTMCFLDMEERRWYSISADKCRLHRMLKNMLELNFSRLVALDGGLVCEYSVSAEPPVTGSAHKLVMFDPLGPSRLCDLELPASTSDGTLVVGKVVNRSVNSLPIIVTVVDNADRSFKVFLMNREHHSHDLSGFFVYESSTNAWRRLATPAERLGVRVARRSHRTMLEESAVFFRGELYGVFWSYSNKSNLLLRYNLEENMWNEVLVLDVPNPEFPQLTVSGNRMFVAIWSCARRPFPDDSYFEIKEILVNEKQSRSVMKISCVDLERITGELKFGIQYGFPLNSRSVVLISRRTGNLVTYDLRTRVVGALPAHPLHHLLEKWEKPGSLQPWEVALRHPHYRAKLTNLSLMNLLL